MNKLTLMERLKYTFKPRSVQDIFDIAIDSGFYGCNSHDRNTSSYMCIAIGNLYEEGYVTRVECKITQRKINEFLHSIYDSCNTLRSALYRENVKNHFENMLAIYRKWSSRYHFIEVNRGK